MVMRRAMGLVALIALLGLVSCADRTPIQPLIGFGPGGPFPPPTPPTPATSGGPADSLLEANRALWSQSGITSYRYRFNWVCFCLPEYVQVVDIIVIDGAIVSVVDASTGQPVSDQARAYYKTIDELFDFMRHAIDFPASSFRFVYDANLGYPADTYVDYVAGMADDEKGFRILGLSPLRRQ